MPDREASAKAEEYLMKTRENLDSSGGVMECMVNGMTAGIGEPVFDKLDACLSKAVMSIGAVKAVSIGDGLHVRDLAAVKGLVARTVADKGCGFGITVDSALDLG